MLQKTYAPMGGIKGSGFNSKEDLIKNINMIKLYREKGKILCGFLYKDRGMRKRVATFTDGSREAIVQLKKMLTEDFKRSIVEVSHNMLRFMERKLPEMIKTYAIPSDKVQAIINKDIEIVDEFKYKRKVGNEYITKILIGTEKKIY